MQLNYFLETEGVLLNENAFRILDISNEDKVLVSNGMNNQKLLSYLGFKPNPNRNYNPIYHFPLTANALAKAKKMKVINKIIIEPDSLYESLYYP